MTPNDGQAISTGHVRLEPGTVIKERYCIERCVGSGASSTVYRAVDTQLASLPVAIKVFSRSFMNLPHFQQMYSRELQTSFAVDHENVVRLYDMIRTKSLIALVTEFIDGITLDQYVATQGGALSEGQTRKVVTSLLRGLNAIHSAGMIHRDVKPENILVSEDGAIKINDFGVAKPGQAGEAHSSKKKPHVSGTPYYTAPEYLAQGQYDSRSDLHSVGIIAFELLAGKQMFDTSSPAGFLVSKVEASIPPVHKIVPDCNPILANIIDRLLLKDPNERFQSSNEALMELEKLPLSGGNGVLLSPDHYDSDADLPNHMVLKTEKSTRRTKRRKSLFARLFSNTLVLYGSIAAIVYYLVNYTDFWNWVMNKMP